MQVREAAIEAFLTWEARLMDEGRYAEWLDLWTDDAQYWVPCNDDDIDPVLRSHYQFQIRTFWIGLLYMAIGIPLCIVLIGFPLLLWWFIWSVIRIVKGTLLATEHKPIANPSSWLFG